LIEEIRPRYIAFVMTALLVVHFALGCMSATRSSSNSLSSAVIGHWRQTTLRVADESKPCPAYFIVDHGGGISCASDDTVEFKPDGTFIAKFSGREIQAIGSWRLQGSTLLVSFAAPPEIAGINRSTTVEVGPGPETITIKSSTDDTPIAETYVRDDK